MKEDKEEYLEKRKGRNVIKFIKIFYIKYYIKKCKGFKWAWL